MDEIVYKLKTASLIITDLYLECKYNSKATQEKSKFKVSKAAFGFKVNFDDLELGPLKIFGFGVLFEYENGPNPSGVTKKKRGKLTTAPIY